VKTVKNLYYYEELCDDKYLKVSFLVNKPRSFPFCFKITYRVPNFEKVSTTIFNGRSGEKVTERKERKKEKKSKKKDESIRFFKEWSKNFSLPITFSHFPFISLANLEKN